MPRMSAEARGASAFRAGGMPPKVPEGFSQEASIIWTEIVSAKPVDWFDGGSLRLLRQFCRTMAQAERVGIQLDSMEMASDERETEALERRLVALNANLTTLATKLRLTVQQKIDTRSGMINEKPERPADDGLLGGNDTWPASARLRAA